MTIYIDHNNPAATQNLTQELIRHGIPHVLALQLAPEIIQHRYTTYNNIKLVHIGR